MAARKTLNLDNLLRQFDARFPHRDHKSDGWIGDEAHKARTSGHNPDDTPGSKPAWDGDPDNIAEVRDLDLDSDLGEPGTSMDDVVAHLTSLPHFDTVCRYLIWNGHWWHSRNDFARQPFTGNPHTEHLHFEGAWSQYADNNTTYDFQLEAIGNMTVSKAEMVDIAAENASKMGSDMALQNSNSGVAKGLRAQITTPILDAIRNLGLEPVDIPSLALELKPAIRDIIHEILRDVLTNGLPPE